MHEYRDCIDLHTHSTTSDGVFTPSEVVFLTLARGLFVAAPTNCGALGGVVEAQRQRSSTCWRLSPAWEIEHQYLEGEAGVGVASQPIACTA